jgi:hypothetical protein
MWVLVAIGIYMQGEPVMEYVKSYRSYEACIEDKKYFTAKHKFPPTITLGTFVCAELTGKVKES